MTGPDDDPVFLSSDNIEGFDFERSVPFVLLYNASMYTWDTILSSLTIVWGGKFFMYSIYIYIYYIILHTWYFLFMYC